MTAVALVPFDSQTLHWHFGCCPIAVSARWLLPRYEEGRPADAFFGAFHAPHRACVRACAYEIRRCQASFLKYFFSSSAFAVFAEDSMGKCGIPDRLERRSSLSYQNSERLADPRRVGLCF